MLHITNGDSTATTLRQTGLRGDVLPWRDILHEGPVPAGLSLEALSNIRARFIADMGWGDRSVVRADFTARDATLASSSAHEEIVLWFEHDLYDQLQLAQILAWLGERLEKPGSLSLSLICIDRFPGVEPFHGLGQLTAAQLSALFPSRQALTWEDLHKAIRVWKAFRSPNPSEIEALFEEDLPGLPFVAAALRRHLEQFPSVKNGLGKTEQLVLDVIADGAIGPLDLFGAYQQLDQPAFMGDWPLWLSVARMNGGVAPLIRCTDGTAFRPAPATERDSVFRAQRLTLTTPGASVRRGEADNVTLNGIDRWLGGVHLQGDAADWRWDSGSDRLVRAS